VVTHVPGEHSETQVAHMSPAVRSYSGMPTDGTPATVRCFVPTVTRTLERLIRIRLTRGCGTPSPCFPRHPPIDCDGRHRPPALPKKCPRGWCGAASRGRSPWRPTGSQCPLQRVYDLNPLPGDLCGRPPRFRIGDGAIVSIVAQRTAAARCAR
jgi:hypothetical protein